MAVLRERKVWKRERSARSSRIDHLSADEEANVRAAMLALKWRYGGGWNEVADAMGASRIAVSTAMKRHRRPTAGLALRAAKLAGVPVDDVLSGAWPRPGSCPMCGRCG